MSIDVRGLERLLGPPRVIAHELRREAADRGVRVHVAVAGTRMAALVLALARPGITVVKRGDEAATLAPLPISVIEKAPAAMPAGASAQRDAPVRHQRAGTALSQEAWGWGPARVKDVPREKVNKVDGLVSPVSPAASVISALKHWGIRTLGELAALPAADLSARLGPQGLACQAVARGEDLQPLVPTLADERFESSLELEWPIEGLEPLSFVLTRLLEPLSTRLERRDRGAAVLHVFLRLVTRDRHARRLELPAPLRDVRTLRALALIDLESHPPPSAIDAVTVVIDPTPGRVLQHTLFARAHPAPDALSTLLARLGALVGQDRIGAPATMDAYRPGAFAMKPFAIEYRAPSPESRAPDHDDHRRDRRDHREHDLETSASLASSAVDGSRAPSPESLASALRRCRQPVPARVAVADGRPVRVATDRPNYVGGAVLACAGPWRSSGNWWSACGHASHAGAKRVALEEQRRPVLDTREGSACGSSEASGGGAPRALKNAASASGLGVGPSATPEADQPSPRLRRSAEALAEAESLRSRPRSSEAVPGVGVGPHASNKYWARESEKSWDRDEWDVALADGAVYRIFQNRETGGWFIDAIVD